MKIRPINHWVTRATLASAAFLTVAMAAEVSASDWSIVSINGSVTQGDPSISFDAEGGFQGNTGCNNFSGAGEPQADHLVVTDPLVTTRMACPGGYAQAQENAVLGILQGRVDLTYDAFSGSLTFSSEGQKMQMSPRLPGGNSQTADANLTVYDSTYLLVSGSGGPLNIREEATTDARVVTRALVGTMLRNLGCTVLPDRTWCQISFIDASGTTGWAAAEFLAPAPAALRASHGVFDDIGRLSCKQALDQAQDCDFGVARDSNHSAAMTVFLPDGSERVLHFADGVLVYAVANPIGEGLETAFSTEDDIVRVTVGHETYEVPEQFISGR